MTAYRSANRTVIVMLAAASAGGETIAACGAAANTWILAEIDGKAFAASPTLTFPDAGPIAEEAPGNRYCTDMTASYPRLETGAIAATRRFHPDNPVECPCFDALSAMTLSEMRGDTLLPSSEDGRTMTFTADA